MYLGMPLIHGKVKKDTFKHIVDRVEGKLTAWKTKLMSLAGRLTLINLVTSTIPTYSMQMCHLPMSICDKLDKINRNFLWGHGMDDKKNHLISWDEVCRPKKRGGLGIRKTRDNNLANLAKLTWNVVKKSDLLWVKVSDKKYVKNSNVLEWNAKDNSSHIWRRILKAQPIICKGIKWNVRKGDKVRL